MFMQLQDLLITEQATVKDAIQQLERLRCKVIYVVKDRKLFGLCIRWRCAQIYAAGGKY